MISFLRMAPARFVYARGLQTSACFFGKRYTKEENRIIDEVFNENMYPPKVELQNLADSFGRSFESVEQKFWRKRLVYSKMYGEKLIGNTKFDEETNEALRESFEKNQKPDLTFSRQNVYHMVKSDFVSLYRAGKSIKI